MAAKWPSLACALIGGYCWAFLAAPPADAKLEVSSSASTEFRAAVINCLEQFTHADPETAAIIKGLQDSKLPHTITQTNLDTNSSEPIIQSNGVLGKDGKAGRGTGSTVRWNPKNMKPYEDGVARDPCASLLHELAHSLHFDKGIADTSDAGGGVAKEEFDATREENRFRKKKGLPQRKKYDDVDLPSDAIFKPALIPSGFKGGWGARSPGAVVLGGAARKTVFAAGEGVTIRARLANHSRRTLSLTGLTLGSLHIVSVLRNGTRAQLHRTITYTDGDLRDAAFLDLERVSAGAALGVPWRSEFDSAFDGQALEDVVVGDDGNNAVRSYSLARPGRYKVTFAYRYPVTAPGGGSVFGDRTNSIEVGFKVG